jgi:PAS domain S-box-containing protein
VFSLSVAIALPSAYFYLSYSKLTEQVEALAKVKAGAVSVLADGNPELWKYNLVRMDELLHRGPFLLTHERVIIRDNADKALLTVGEPPEAPILTLSAPVYDFGQVVGRVDVVHSYRAVILEALLTALLGLLLGILVYAVSILPLRALRRASAALIKEQAALIASEEHYRSLFDRASDGIMTLTPDGKLVAVNKSFARMHGYSVDEILAINLNDLDTPKTRHLIAERMPRILSGEALTFEVEHYHKDGHAFPLEVSSSLISSDGEPIIQALHRDISERKQHQSMIEERNALLTHQKVELEDTLGRIKRLEGLLSICMQCKKIRTEDNDWRQLEQYIGEHSDAVFSHGLCPACLEKAMKKLG